MAIAGGVNTYTHPYHFADLSKLHMLSPTGRSRTFAAGADGFAPGEGVGALLLKPLRRAVADGDHVHATIVGSAINHGGKSNGFTVPNPKAQSDVIRWALERAKIDGRRVTYVEAHGTGTELGDPIEIRGLTDAFSAPTGDRRHCRIGSLKTNIGHLEAAAGVAGVTKVLLQMKHGRLAPSLHAEQLNPHIDFTATPFTVQRLAEPWQPHDDCGAPMSRVACVSSFGAGGSNAHVILEEHAREAAPCGAVQPALFVLSARSEKQLAVYVRRFGDFLDREPRLDLEDACYTLQLGREALDVRLACVVESTGELREKLRTFEAGAPVPGVLTGSARRQTEAAGLFKTDDDAQELIAIWLAKRKLSKLAEVWTQGIEVDWQRMHAPRSRRRVSLPPYPFERRSHPIPLPTPARHSAGKALHPLQEEKGPAAGGTRFEACFEGTESFLADHMVGGQMVLPGVVYLELAHAAAARWFGPAAREGSSIVLSNVVWMKPFVCPESGSSLDLELSPGRPGEVVFRARSRGAEGEPLTYAQGAARCEQLVDAAPRPASVDVASIIARAAKVYTAAELYGAYTAVGIQYGPMHRIVEQLHVGTKELLARLHLPAIADEAGKYTLHPSLLDGALQATIGLTFGRRDLEAALPFSLAELRVLGECTTPAWVYVRYDDRSANAVPTHTIQICDDRGNVRIQMSGFCARPQARGKAVAPVRNDGIDEPRALLFGRQRRAEAPLASEARPFDKHVVVVCGLEAGHAGNLERTLRSGDTSGRIRCVTWRSSLPSEDRRFGEYARSLLEELQGVLAAGFEKALIQLVYDRVAEPALRGLSGMLRTAQLESTRIVCQTIGVESLVDIAEIARTAIENSRPPVELEIEYVESTRYVVDWAEIVPVESERPGGPPWRHGGVYLITGGAGGLGRIAAREIARRCRDPRIVLVGRSGRDEKTNAQCRELGALGAHAEYLTADIANATEVTALVARIERDLGPLAGVVHAAGILADNRLVKVTEAELERVLAPKVAGLVALDEATGHSPLDFFVVFSSIAGALGNPGQAGYAAGNAFMDAYVQRREAFVARGLRSGVSVAIDWPFWREGGMLIDAATEEAMEGSAGLVPMPTEVGLSVLRDLLGRGSSQTLVAFGRGERIRSTVEKGGARAGRDERTKADSKPMHNGSLLDDQRQPASGFAVDGDTLRAWMQEAILQATCELLKVPHDELDADTKLSEYGFDSISFTELSNLLNRRFSLQTSPVLFFEYPNASSLARSLVDEYAESLRSHWASTRVAPSGNGAPGEAQVPPVENAVTKGVRVLREPAEAQAEPTAVESRSEAERRVAKPRTGGARFEPVAVIGMSGRFPMAEDLDAFWANLVAGTDCITEIPASRWNWRDYDGDPVTEPNKTNIRWGGFIDGIDEFDPRFFGISPREALVIDPQQRLLWMYAWKAIEDAGYAPSRLAGSNTAIYVGTGHFGYGDLLREAGVPIEGYTSAGLVPSMGPNRMSFMLDLHGPSEPIETACSSSLVAVHRAMVALNAGLCDLAIVGGVNTMVTPDAHICFTKAGMLSPGGRCKTFSAAADGYVRGEGVGILVLKRLAEAEADGDPIHGVIRGSAENHGGEANSLTSPNPAAQAAVIRAAYESGGVDIDGVGYIEAHGTGTNLGDPIEVRGLTDAYAALGGRAEHSGRCGLGSVKTNIGHLELAAGVAGVIKVLLQMKHATLVPTLGCDPVNPYIDLQQSPFRVVRETCKWERLSDDRGRDLPLRAGVSSFGFGGVNAHVVLEEYIPSVDEWRGDQDLVQREVVIILSAKSEERLRARVEQLRAFVRTPDGGSVDLVRLAYTLQTGRDEMSTRLAFTAASLQEVEAGLEAALGGTQASWPIHRGTVRCRKEAPGAARSPGRTVDLPGARASRERIDALARAWVDGQRVAWRDLYPGSAPRRIALPTYPFARESYWVSKGKAADEAQETATMSERVASKGQGTMRVEAPQAEAPARRVTPIALRPTADGHRETAMPTGVASEAASKGASAPEKEGEAQVVEPSSDAKRRVIEHLTASLAEALYIDASEVREDSEFVEIGMDSVVGVEWIRAVNKEYGTSLSVTKIYEHPSVSRFAQYLTDGLGVAGARAPSLQPAVEEVRPQARPLSVTPRRDDIAIIGASGRYPNAEGLEQYWDNLRNGVSCISEVPKDRWDWSVLRGRYANVYCRWMGSLADVDAFDPLFFHMAPSEAEVTDPQHRLFWQEGYRALEDAGYCGEASSTSKCGVYLGLMGNEYSVLLQQRCGGPGNSTGTSASIAASRLAYFLNLKGPAIAVDTACSSSLVAVHLACQALWSGEIDMALVGGVTLYLAPESYVAMCEAGMLSPRGQCRPFDGSADGFVPGEGVGAIVLKRLSDAERDGDHIYGVVVASGTNQDGKTNGITAPSVGRQRELVRDLYAARDIDPASIGYVEMHGTGTKVGDPIELDALAAVFREKTDGVQTCCIGSVKGNIGHTSAAAGVASIHKVLLCLRSGQLVPSLNYESPNEHFDIARSPFRVNTELATWKLRPTVARRRAGISSFGFSGTNAHVVIEEYVPSGPPAPPPARVSGLAKIFVLSAKSPSSLRESVRLLRDYVERRPDLDLPKLAYTLQVGRLALEHRVAVVSETRDDLLVKLTAIQAVRGDPPPGVSSTSDGGGRAGEGEDATSRAHGWLEARSEDEIADAWASGRRVDWESLYPGARPGRVSAPTYPFAKERYWLPSVPVGDANGFTSSVPRHPLLHENTSSTSELRFTSVFVGTEDFLSDHRVHGRVLVPAVIQLEMVRAAAMELAVGASSDGLVSLENVVWARPLALGPSSLEVHVGLRFRGDGISAFRIYTRTSTGEELVHSQGAVRVRARPRDPGAGEGALDVQRLLRECGVRVLEGSDCYRSFAQVGMEYGVTYRGIRRIHVGHRQLLAELSSQGQPSDRFVLNPGVLDSALQATVGLADPGDVHEGALPFGVERVVVERPCPRDGWARVTVTGRRNDAPVRFDVVVYDADGTRCVSMEGFTLRAPARAGSEPRFETSVLLLAPSPTPMGLSIAASPPARPSRGVVVTCDVTGSLDAAREERVTQIALRSDRPEGAERFQDFATQLWKELRRASELARAEHVYFQVVVPARSGSLLRGLSGLLRTATLENPRLVTQLVELSANEAKGVRPALFAPAGRGLNRDVKYEDGDVVVGHWEELDAGRGGGLAVPWRNDGVYLITGGLGGVGRIFAREIARHASRCTLVFCGRSPADSTVAGRIDEIGKLGPTADYVQADVSRLRELTQLRSTILGRYHGLTGVLHAAGVVRDGFLSAKESPSIEVLAAKVAGVENLDRITQDLGLEFFVLFSSIAGPLGSVGQADYAAANAYLDAYARHRSGLVAAGLRSGRTLSIDWPLWAEGGMQVHESVRGLAATRSGLSSLSTSDAIRAFYDAYGTGADQVMILSGDAQRLRTSLMEAGYLEALGGAASSHAALTAAGDDGPQVARDDVAGMVEHLRSAMSTVLKIPRGRLQPHVAFEAYGVDSINMIQIIAELEKQFGALSKTLLFEHQTIDHLARHLARTFADRLPATHGARAHGSARDKAAAPVAELSAVGRAAPRGAPVSSARTETSPLAFDVAVVGLSGCYPGARDIEQFWSNLRDGIDSVGEVPEARWDCARFFDPDRKKQGTIYCNAGGFLEGAAEFDPRFFNISPKEAAYIEPQERLFLQAAHACLEDAGYTRWTLPGADGGTGAHVGVFVGVMYQEYQLYGIEETLRGNVLALPGNSSSIANRVSYFFDLRGPSMAVDTMCSSSLTAIHLAIQSLRAGDCEAAIVGGVNLSLHPNKYLGLSQGKFVSTKGRCESFGVGGDGYVPSEGVGAALIKLLPRAQADGDRIYAIIKATALNHGGRTSGYSVPNPVAQGEVIARCLRGAGVDPRTLSYVEAHGTGTSLGDPIEINGLQRAFEPFTRDRSFCAIGSVKSNIGHCESAAGIAGLTKLLLQLKHGKLVPSLHSEVLNPHIAFSDTAFFVQQSLADWKRPVLVSEGHAREVPRRCALSSFGAGGSNAHLIVEEYVEAAREHCVEAGAPAIVVLSARDLPALRGRAERLRDSVRSGELRQADLHDIAFTLLVGREHMAERLGFIVSSVPELVAALDEFLAADEDSGAVQGAPRRIWRSRVEQTSNGLARIGADEDIQRAIAAWVAKRKYESLLDLWAQGLEMDWSGLYAPGTVRRIRLPTYPFARECYWVPGRETASAAAAPRGVEAASSVVEARGNGVALAQKTAAVVSPPVAAPVASGVASRRIVLPPLQAATPTSSSGLAAPNAEEGVSVLQATAGAPESHPADVSPRRLATSSARPSLPALAVLQGGLAASLARALYLQPSEVGVDRGFAEIGLDSIVAVEWVQDINKAYGTNIAATRIYDYPSVRELAKYVLAQIRALEGAATSPAEAVRIDDVLGRVQRGELTAAEANALLAPPVAGAQ